MELRGAQEPRGIVFSAKGDFIACGSDTQDGVTVWNRAGQVMRKLEAGEAAVAAFDPLGRWLMTGSRHGYRAWKIGSWEESLHVDTGSGNIDTPAVVFSPDGNYIAALDPAGNISLFAGRNGGHLATLEAPFAIMPEFLLFSGDSRWLTAEGIDQTLQRWDIQALREELAKLGLDWVTN
jgi:WD40 repeat protein